MKHLRNIVIALTAFVISTRGWSQDMPPVSRVADVQAGATFSFANPDYANDVYNLAQPTNGENSWHGYGIFADVDIRAHYGVEFNVHQLSGPDPNLYERTFQIGGRYRYPVYYGRFTPYARAMVGRGIFNFAAIDGNGVSQQLANIGYNEYSLGGGLDMRLTPAINLRLFDYEYQTWQNFPPRSLSPQIFSFGVAYHFHGPLGARY